MPMAASTDSYAPKAASSTARTRSTRDLDDIVIREWAPDGSFAGAMLLLGRLAKGALAAKPQDVPLLREKLAWLLERLGGASNSHAFRETRALFNHFPRRELLYADAASIKDIIDKMLHVSGDDEIVVAMRQGNGYKAVSIADTYRLAATSNLVTVWVR